VTNMSIRLQADTGRYLTAIPATNSRSGQNGIFAQYNVSYVSIDSDLPVRGTLFTVVPISSTEFSLSSELGCTIQTAFTSDFSHSSAFLTYCGPEIDEETQSITATPVATGLTYSNPIIGENTIAPYVFNETIRLMSTSAPYQTLQWTGLHEDVAGLPSTQFNSSGSLVQFASPLYNYQDAFRLTIVGNASDGVISLTTVDGWTLSSDAGMAKDFPLLANASPSNLTVMGSLQPVGSWSIMYPDVNSWFVFFESVSDAQLSRLLEDLANDQAGWNTSPSNATLQTMISQPEYATVCSTLANVFNEELILVSVANSAIMATTSTTAIARTDMNVSQVVANRHSLFLWSATFGTSCGSSVQGTPAVVQLTISTEILMAGTSRQLQDPKQLGLDSVFPVLTQRGALVPQDWYVSILGQGTNFNGTNMTWYNITLQHPWLLGWYVGVCETCAWGTVGPNGEPETAVVLMESTPQDPRVQWTLLVATKPVSV